MMCVIPKVRVQWRSEAFFSIVRIALSSISFIPEYLRRITPPSGRIKKLAGWRRFSPITWDFHVVDEP